MSFQNWHTYGYGVKLSEIEKISMCKVVELIQTAPNFAKKFNEWLRNCEIKEPTLEDLSEFDDYGIGLAMIMQQVILEIEDLELIACNDYCDETYLLFPECYPWTMTEREKNLKESDIQALIVKYFAKITDEVIIVDYYEPENGG